MTTAQEATEQVQQKVLESIRVGQKAVVDTVRSWSEVFETAFSKLPDFAGTTTGGARPTQYFESAVSFTEKVINSQREFATQLFEAAIPATRAAPAAAQSAAQSARSGSTKV